MGICILSILCQISLTDVNVSNVTDIKCQNPNALVTDVNVSNVIVTYINVSNHKCR